ncbi:MAG: HU family DNA-binding protein [Saccharofermentanales bacterium]
MNKTELVAAISKDTQLSKKDSELALNAITGNISSALAKGDKVVLVGFGTFEVRKRAARKGRNPATGAAIKISASKAPAFKAGKGLKDKVNK